MTDIGGDQLGVRTADLWLCGRSFLPSAAKAVLAANHITAGASNDAPRFARTGNVSGSPYTGTTYGQVYPAWDRLRDAFQRILADSADNLYETGDALVLIAKAYAESDDAALSRFQMNTERYAMDPDYPIDNPATRQPSRQP